MKLEDSDFFLCEEDGQEFYQLNIQEGFKKLILSNQDKLAKIDKILGYTEMDGFDKLNQIREILK